MVYDALTDLSLRGILRSNIDCAVIPNIVAKSPISGQTPRDIN